MRRESSPTYVGEREASPRLLKALRRRRLSAPFFARDALTVAADLVGTHLVAEVDSVARVARIVETEAYRGPTDAACHARVGVTKRTKTLYGAPGTAYVYLIYGMYDCFNVVCHAEGSGHAVLVRAVEPIAGAFLGARFDGPGRLTRALGVSRAHDGASLLRGEALYLASADALAPSVPPRLLTTARVNVAYAGAVADEPWRFYDADSRHVSRPPARSLGLGGNGR